MPDNSDSHAEKPNPAALPDDPAKAPGKVKAKQKPRTGFDPSSIKGSKFGSKGGAPQPKRLLQTGKSRGR
jgi:hypothetical protein